MAFKSSIAHRMINTIEKIDRKKQSDPVSQSMQTINNTQQTVNQLNDLIPKLYAAQQNQHKYQQMFIDQLTSLSSDPILFIYKICTQIKHIMMHRYLSIISSNG